MTRLLCYLLSTLLILVGQGTLGLAVQLLEIEAPQLYEEIEAHHAEVKECSRRQHRAPRPVDASERRAVLACTQTQPIVPALSENLYINLPRPPLRIQV